MTAHRNDDLRSNLIDDWQRDLPLVSRPFAVIAKRLGVSEACVIKELKRLRASGVISRVGGVVRPNTLGASTLAAVAAPEFRTEDIAALLSREPGVNHVYLRENDYNIWFVVTGPDRAYVDAALTRVAHATGLRVLDLRLEKAYHIDLGFALSGHTVPTRAAAPAHPIPNDGFAIELADRPLVQALTDGLPIAATPFRELAEQLGRSEADVIERLRCLVANGIVPRIGVIVRHRAIGWRSNAMVVWDVDAREVDRIGAALASSAGINLCYRRTRYAREWPYNLYCMVHARTRDEALSLLENASQAAGLVGVPRQILFSLRCFKQTGALVTTPRVAA